MRPWTGTLAAIALFFAACSLTQPLDQLSDRECPAGQKPCNNRCVAIDDPATGCASAQCGPCRVANATAACSAQGECTVARCEEGFDSCDGDPANGCESNLSNDVAHCGSCARFCSAAKATSACIDGRCVLTSCSPGYSDCNRTAADGCEAQLSSDPKNCGGCDKPCPAGRQCSGGVCLVVSSASTGASSRHACALLSNGQSLCWGDNSSSQLGNGQVCSKPPCVATSAGLVPDLPDLRGVATGQGHTCGVNAKGVVFCWGDNSSGQLGLGSVEAAPRPLPRSVDGLSGVTALAAGARHTCALAAGGAVLCWGEGSYGQTGGGDGAATVAAPRAVLLAGKPLTGAVAIAAGGRSTCAALQNGAAYCWGDDSAGQLGNGGQSADVCKPTGKPSCAYAPLAVKGVSEIVNVSCGEDATCLLDKLGDVWCAGSGADGRLGNDSDQSSSVPLHIVEPNGMTALSTVRLGNGHACAIQASNGNLWCWGRNDRGQLFEDPSTPSRPRATLTSLLVNPSQVVTGANFTCGITQGSLLCVGDNTLGQLGQGAGTDPLAHPTPTKVSGLP